MDGKKQPQSSFGVPLRMGYLQVRMRDASQTATLADLCDSTAAAVRSFLGEAGAALPLRPVAVDAEDPSSGSGAVRSAVFETRLESLPCVCAALALASPVEVCASSPFLVSFA